MPLRERALHIIEDYRPWENKVELLKAYSRIKDRIHTPIAKEIEKLSMKINLRRLLASYWSIIMILDMNMQ
jgi:hypothetical protein